MVVKQHWRKGFAHVPLHVVGQQAHKHMGSDPIGEPVQDRSQLQINYVNDYNHKYTLRHDYIHAVTAGQPKAA